jgi:hypothetical protein
LRRQATGVAAGAERDQHFDAVPNVEREQKNASDSGAALKMPM